jgi:16S rRNA (adenine1518-N6/adenine1519-N6)-dimethyltransferase
VSAAEITSGDRVLEIGAGLGSLTRPLAERAAEVGADVLAVEFDRALVPALREVVSDLPNVEVLQADALSAPWQELLAGDRWSVVANLPYNVAVPILLRLLEGSPEVQHYVVMVQEEVAERLSAQPGDRGYGPTSLRVAYRAEVEVLRTVPPTVFWPRPHVGSAVMRLRTPPNRGSDAVDATALFHVIDVSFSERRKTMRSALRRLGVPASRVAEVLRSAEIDPDARPESLPLDRFAAVAERIDSQLADGADG